MVRRLSSAIIGVRDVYRTTMDGKGRDLTPSLTGYWLQKGILISDLDLVKIIAPVFALTGGTRSVQRSWQMIPGVLERTGSVRETRLYVSKLTI